MKIEYSRNTGAAFDREELYESLEDKEALLGMSETRREEILYKRHLQLKKFRERKELEEKVAKLEQPRIFLTETPKQPSGENDFAEFSKCVVSRDMIAWNVFKPFFDEFIGHFIRVRINGLYLVAKIVKISKGEPYCLHINKETVKTNRYLSISTGTRVYENFKIENVSNAPLLEEEYEDVWRSFKIGPVSKICERYTKLEEIMSKKLNDDEITKMVGQRNEVYPQRRCVAHLKIELIQKRDKAIEAKDGKTAMECQKMIEKLEDHSEN